jgi:hypothetical protein
MNLEDQLRQNRVPIYFIECSLFLGLGMDSYIGALHLICAAQTFNSSHLNIFVPQSFVYNYWSTDEEIINGLLCNQEVIQYIKTNGRGKLITFFLDETTEKLAMELELEVCLPPSALRNYWGNKISANRLAECAGIPCVPYVLSPLENYSHLRRLTAHLGTDLVIQMPHGHSGETTFFISNQSDFEKNQNLITNGEEVRIMKRINCVSTGLEGCITRYGIVTSPLFMELISIPELNLFPGGWSGNELFSNAFPESILTTAQNYAVRMGEQLRLVGYKGHFEVDFLIDKEHHTLYLGEINLRFCGFTPMFTHALMMRQETPLLLFHLAEWLDISYDVDIESLNHRWMTLPQKSLLSFLFMHHVFDTPSYSIPSGVYRMNPGESVIFVRSDMSLPLLDSGEIFWISAASDMQLLQKGHEVGGLLLPERATTDGRQLNAKAKAWIKGLRKIGDARFKKYQRCQAQ